MKITVVRIGTTISVYNGTNQPWVAAKDEREREELRGRILDAARELFARNGFEQTTIRMIADRIEYSTMAIYSHFQDKEALLRELCEVDFTALVRSMEKAMKSANPVERLMRIGELYVDFATKHPNHYRFMFMSAPGAERKRAGEQNATAQERAYAFIRKAVEDVIALGVIREEYRDVDLLTQMVWASIHGIVSLHLTAGHVKWIKWRPLKQVTRLISQALGQGVAITPGSAPEPAAAAPATQPAPAPRRRARK